MPGLPGGLFNSAYRAWALFGNGSFNVVDSRDLLHGLPVFHDIQNIDVCIEALCRASTDT